MNNPGCNEGDSDSRLPELVRWERIESNAFEGSFTVPHDIFYVRGHFPGEPIVPGFVQVGWALHYCREHFGEVRFSELKSAKFQQLLRPGEQFVLGAQRTGAGRIDFYLERDRVRISGGIVLCG